MKHKISQSGSVHITSLPILILLVFIAVSGRSVSSDVKSIEPLVKITKGADLETALQTLHRSTGRLVVSECPKVEHRSRKESGELPLGEALPVISTEYDLHGLVGAKQFLFVRRFLDAREEPDVSLAEINALVSDVHRLINPLSPHFKGLRSSFERREFYRSLTPEQIDLARRGELTFANISPDQQKQWRMLTAEHAFNVQENELRTTLAIFRNWSQCDAFWGSVHEEGSDIPTLQFRYPIQLDTGIEKQTLEITRRYEANNNLEPEQPVGSLEPLADTPRLRTSCSKIYRQLTQPATLGEIVSSIAKDNQVTVRIPSYARERRYYLFSRGTTGNEVLKALADINGWDIYETGKQRYALDRPRIVPARDNLEFYRSLRRIIPPVVRTTLEVNSDRVTFNSDDVRQARLARSWSRFFGYLDEHHRPPTGFRTVDLDAEQQLRLANLILEGKGLRVPLQFLLKSRPPGWLVDIERGFFKLEGEVGPGKRPSLEFYVLREKQEPTTPGARPRFIFDCWGWIVNSSALGD